MGPVGGPELTGSVNALVAKSSGDKLTPLFKGNLIPAVANALNEHLKKSVVPIKPLVRQTVPTA